MNGIMGTAELLVESGLKSEQLALAHTLRESAQHLLQIINDVIDFSKLEADRVEPEHVVFDVRQVVRGAVDIFAPQARAKSLDLSASVSPDVPALVLGDPARLRQVLLNLIGNGIKFTATGGVSVTVDLKQPASADCIVLAFVVADTGIGIPADAIGLLFREFSQLDDSIARRFGGTGLGLAICKRLVALMGGSISVKSKVGFGSIFRFTAEVHTALQQAADMAPAATQAGAQAIVRRADGRRARVLLAEDNLTNRLVESKLLQALGVDVDLANNGVEAVTACASTVYDVVLMDVMMPEMDGIAATRAIRQLPGPYCEARIIALTAMVQPSDRDMCIESGMDDFLSKPVTRSGLANALQRYCRLDEDAQDAHTAHDAGDALETPTFSAAPYRMLERAIGSDKTRAVLNTFVQDTKKRIEAMRKEVEVGAKANVAIDAHATKSSAAMLGFQKLSTLARTLEAEVAELDRQQLENRINQLSDAYAEVCQLVLSREGKPSLADSEAA
jgi:CheY-like chemotaxis protein/HPt (histidine-containing phosphotransfer) domain-containing protein